MSKQIFILVVKKQLMKQVFAVLLTLAVFSASAQDTTLTAYKGIYRFAEGSPTTSVEISIQNDALYANSTIGSAALVRVNKDTFDIPDYNGVVYFFRDEAGKIKSIRIEVEDLVLEGNKDTANMALIERKRRRAVLVK